MGHCLVAILVTIISVGASGEMDWKIFVTIIGLLYCVLYQVCTTMKWFSEDDWCNFLVGFCVLVLLSLSIYFWFWYFKIIEYVLPFPVTQILSLLVVFFAALNILFCIPLLMVLLGPLLVAHSWCSASLTRLGSEELTTLRNKVVAFTIWLLFEIVFVVPWVYVFMLKYPDRGNWFTFRTVL